MPHNISHHIDYITPGIKLMSSGYDEKVMKRMLDRRTWYEEGRRPKKHGSAKSKNKNGGGLGVNVKPDGDADDDDEFTVTGGCDVDITPQCVRGEFTYLCLISRKFPHWEPISPDSCF